MTSSPYTLPPNLPVPMDDGACDHLRGQRLPALELPSTSGRLVDLARETTGRTVFFFYPRTGIPGQPPSRGHHGEDWDDIPGARGCTPQSCGFRDWHNDFVSLGVRVLGVSTNTTEHQREFIARTHMPFEFLSDAELRLTKLLRLPTFEFPIESGGPTTMLQRMAWYIENATIEKVFYPVFPPNQNAVQVLAWVRRRAEKQWGRGEPTAITVRPLEQRDLTWVRQELRRVWGDVRISSMGKWFDAETLPGFIAEVGVERVGLLTHTPMERGAMCEIVTLSARLENAGVGIALMEACESAARHAGCSRLMLTTSNDNLRAIGFYQKRGWRLVAVHRGAIDVARREKATIPTIGNHAIPIHDEIELERVLEERR